MVSMINQVSGLKFSQVNSIQTSQKTSVPQSLGLQQDKFEYQNKASLNFGSSKYQLPLDIMKKEGEKALEKMKECETIKDKIINFDDYSKAISRHLTRKDKTHANLQQDFYNDFTHELFGSFLSGQQINISKAKKKNDSEAIDNALKIMVNHVDKTSKMYQYFIDNKMDSPTTTIGANKVFDLVMEAFTDKAVEKNIKIEIENEKLLKKYSHATTQDYKNYIIMSNLVANAIKYSPENSKVKIEFGVQEKKLHFSIDDNGIGIKPEEHGSVVNGQRASNVGNIPGTGYGLSRINSILASAGNENLKITSPLYPNAEYGGTKMECDLISDTDRSKFKNFINRLFNK